MLKRTTALVLIFFSLVAGLKAQDETPSISYTGKAHEYVIAEIKVTGDLNNDPQILANLSGLRVGQRIMVPGEPVSSAIKKYWDYGLFSDVKITADKIEGDQIFLNIYLQERPRLSEIKFTGLKKSEVETVSDKISMMKGSQVTTYLIDRAEKYIKDYFVEKGFFNTEVNIVQRDDPSKPNHVFLDVDVDKKDKVKVSNLTFEGNEVFSYHKLNRFMKKTNEKGKIRNFFRTKKFVNEEYATDLQSIIEKYNEFGYRDAQIVYDSISRNPDNTVDLVIALSEGSKYYIGDITWVGNTIYPGPYLTQRLRIKKGDIFNQTLLDKRLFEDEDAVHNEYLNTGYLFSNIQPVDLRVANDTVDLEMRVYEGDQATIDKVIIKGNTKTHEHVVRREIRTKPGELFSKAELIRTVRELSQLGHFDPEKINPVPIPDPEKGTVDLEYNLEEKANDQIELSGGWGGGMFVGSLGLKFTNFSVRNIFNKEAWRPLPTGDGQTLSLRAQSNGKYYQSYSFSFTEPWLGGKKPNSLSVSLHRSIQTGVNSSYYYGNQSSYGGYGGYGSAYGSGYGSGYGSSYASSSMYDTDEHMNITGLSVGFGKRLSWPDDFFQLYTQVSFQHYDLKNWTYFIMENGNSNNLNFKVLLSRNSIDNPLYTRNGSEYTLGVEFTPPYSAFDDRDFSDADMDDEERYQWIEYHKWTFKSSSFKSLDPGGKLILMTKLEGGFLGYYDKNKKSPFEKFVMGGDGMSGYSYYGSETIGLRGYENASLTPYTDQGRQDGNLYTKMALELRYPLTLQPSATVYGLLFAEAGNSWSEFRDYNPFGLKRSAGVGLRIFLPIFGLMGIDWGYGFDDIPGRPSANGSNFHFVIGQNF